MGLGVVPAPRWSWVGACATGSAHLRRGAGCDDAGACLELDTDGDATLVAVVSDGAGSAPLAALGSRIVTRSFCGSARTFVRQGGRAGDVDDALAEDWLDEMRDRIGRAGGREGKTPSALAATLVGCIVQARAAVVVHVGDGACALRLAGGSDWVVPSWPAQGEYASTTHFVTDDPGPRCTVTRLDGEVEEVAVFTDGIERLALDFGGRRAFAPFFESMFPCLRGAPAGRQRRVSADLRAFLASPAVLDRTDDDKTLLMARLPRGG